MTPLGGGIASTILVLVSVRPELVLSGGGDDAR
jgi:hypothetical protein